MFDWFRKKQASRKYVDLIKDASAKWANWDPPKTIQAGDFGVINMESGQLERVGNIYTHPETVEIAKKYPAKAQPADEMYVVNSTYTKRSDRSAGVSGGVASVASATINAEFKFEKRRGAFLVMHNPHMNVVPDEFCQETLDSAIFKNRKLVLVTEAFTCDGYVLYLSNKQSETVSVALEATAPVAAAASVGANIENAWSLEGGSGLLRRGYCKGGYTPLYYLKSIQPPPARRRESPDPNAVEGDRWGEVEVPWDFLDSDGEEEPEEEFSDSE